MKHFLLPSLSRKNRLQVGFVPFLPPSIRTEGPLCGKLCFATFLSFFSSSMAVKSEPTELQEEMWETLETSTFDAPNLEKEEEERR